jgi:DNA repair protein SbcC/Rad50
MNWRDLESLGVTDFRSIRGSLAIPLQAPITLIHGSNGAGKTSVLSALELALTGDVHSLEDVQPENLVFRGRNRAIVELEGHGEKHRIEISGGRVIGAPLLSESDATFFTERCYLGQAILAKLLQSYTEIDGSEDSALTRFVRELLRIDELDALIDGLWILGDRRRIRRDVPSFDLVERRISALTESKSELRQRYEELSASQANARARITELLRELGDVPEWDGKVADGDAIDLWVRAQSFETRLATLYRHRRDLQGAAQRLELLEDGATRAPHDSEAAAIAARRRVQAWRAEVGAALEKAISEVQQYFPDLPSSVSQDPLYALDAALDQAQNESQRLRRVIESEESRQGRREAADREAAQMRARLAIVDDELGAAAPASRIEALARDLAALSAHITTEQCPVCGRDFSEASSEPLKTHLSNEVARLSEQAAHIEALMRTRLEALSDYELATKARDALQQGGTSATELVAAGNRLARLEQLEQTLSSLRDGATEGATVLRRQQQAERELAAAHERDESGRQLRITLEEVAKDLSQPPPESGESVEIALHRLEAHVESMTAELELQNVRCKELVQVRASLRGLHCELAKVQDRGRESARALEAAQRAMNELENRRAAAKRLRDAAISKRGTVIRSVFSDALNESWRDLFVRLAPSEPFVPAFKLPASISESLTAELHTVHRDGGYAGAPEVMLSAGNLNTAALTLFLALHLSAPPRLPWLVLDDPVQSMDEIHISQLAALLRTLARQHGIKILIAVHERALFDYLSLELSPAGVGDEVVTVELRRIPDGDASATIRHHRFEEDRALLHA